jgi:DNA-binding response OmpR family regulator
MKTFQILLIEDTEDLGEMIVDILTMEGFMVTWAKDGLQGLSLFNENIPHLVITDVIMPNVNGLAVVQKIRGEQHGKKMPIIILSAKASPEDEEAGYKAGATMYLKKPCTSKLLISTVRTLLSNYE